MGLSGTGIRPDIIAKYQNIAPKSVIQAVAVASRKTGADFSFMMEKASTESGFDAKATSSTSSATGLYQFISTTWLGMIKKYGAKYGLGQYADQISYKNGKACVEDCDARKKILSLRNDPAISALMAGEYTAENRAYLKAHTSGDVGSTELYLAHFMGAGGAAKFLNSRTVDAHAVGAEIFPHEARANHHVFYAKNGQPRTLEQIYNFFDKKFSDDGDDAATPAQQTADVRHTTHLARTLPVFDDANEKDDIIWSDDPRFQHKGSLFLQHGHGLQRLSPGSIMALSAMSDMTQALFPTNRHTDRHGYNS